MVHRSGADQRCPSPVKLISILVPVPIGFVATAKTAVRQRRHPMAGFDPQRSPERQAGNLQSGHWLTETDTLASGHSVAIAHIARPI